MSSSSPKPAVATEFTARVSRFGGAVFVLFLAASFASSLWLFASGKIQMLAPDLSRDAVLHGEVTHRIAKQLSESGVAQKAADLERGASWLLFHDTGARVRPGCTGWLFLTDEMRINRHAQVNAQTKAAAVRQIQQQLAGRGIRLLVAV
ncbi:MAG: cell division protein FtsQ, partial [Pseudomonas sp.]|nr:cell division protein FtsQ [Pseudomonas sp.]